MPGRRIVLLEMRTEDAEEFVRDIVNRAEGSSTVVPSGTTVEAVVARPTRWCECNVVPETSSQRRRRQARKREGGWTRGHRFGWWMCVQCRKPSRAMVTHWITTMLVGANDLLPQILGTGHAQMPSERWEHEGGISNEHANQSAAMPYATTPKRRRKPRRSDTDRERLSNG